MRSTNLLCYMGVLSTACVDLPKKNDFKTMGSDFNWWHMPHCLGVTDRNTSTYHNLRTQVHYFMIKNKISALYFQHLVIQDIVSHMLICMHTVASMIVVRVLSHTLSYDGLTIWQTIILKFMATTSSRQSAL